MICRTLIRYGQLAVERLVKTIRRATRNQYSAEEKARIVLDGLRGESRIRPRSNVMKLR